MKKISLSFLAIAYFSSCSENKGSGLDQIQGFDIIDSVWCTPPGFPHTLQTDYVWYGKTLSGKIVNKRNSEIKIGDTVWIISKSSDTSHNRL